MKNELELKEMEYEQRVKEYEQRSVIDRERLTMDKITLLTDILSETIPVEDSMPGSESKWAQMLSDRNRNTVEIELMKLIKKIC